MIRRLDEQRQAWAWLDQRPPWLLQVAFDVVWFWRVLFPHRTRRLRYRREKYAEMGIQD